MDVFVELLTRGPGVTLWILAGMCGLSFVGSLIAGAMGLGGGALVLAVMALVFPPTVVIPLHGVVQLGSNLGRATLMWREVLWSVMPAFLVGTILGVAVGANVLLALPTPVLQMVVALFVLYAAWAPRFRGGTPSRAKFFGVGTVGAFTTMFVGATGPLIAPFVAASTPERQKVVATHAMMMTLQHGFKIVAFGAIGFAFAPYAALLAGMLAFGLLGTICGRNILMRLPEKVFRIGFSLLLTALALRLGYSAARGMMG